MSEFGIWHIQDGVSHNLQLYRKTREAAQTVVEHLKQVYDGELKIVEMVEEPTTPTCSCDQCHDMCDHESCGCPLLISGL